MAKVIWTMQAANDFEQACDYLEKDSPAYAQFFAEEVWRVFESAAAQPHVGAMVETFAREDVRERRVHSYRLIYQVVSGGILALAVLHGARQFPTDLLDR